MQSNFSRRWRARQLRLQPQLAVVDVLPGKPEAACLREFRQLPNEIACENGFHV
jgi:hypothetical protein